MHCCGRLEGQGTCSFTCSVVGVCFAVVLFICVLFGHCHSPALKHRSCLVAAAAAAAAAPRWWLVWGQVTVPGSAQCLFVSSVAGLQR